MTTSPMRPACSINLSSALCSAVAPVWLRGLGKRAHQVVEVRRPRACRQLIADRLIEGDQRHGVALAGQNVGQGRKERCRVVQLADITASPVHRA